MIYYRDDHITIYHGDSLDILPSLSGVDAVITDPPYGFGMYDADNDKGVVDALRWAFINSKTTAVFNYPEGLVQWCMALDRVPDEWVTWWPTNKPGGRTPKLNRESEAIAFWGQLYEMPTRPRSEDAMTRRITETRGNNLDECKAGDVWRDPSPGAGFNNHLRLHPNEKPESVLKKIILMCSTAGQTILDPFLGSGTTLRVAKDMGRRGIGIEINEAHCEIAAKRMAQEVLF